MSEAPGGEGVAQKDQPSIAERAKRRAAKSIGAMKRR